MALHCSWQKWNNNGARICVIIFLLPHGCVRCARVWDCVSPIYSHLDTFFSWRPDDECIARECMQTVKRDHVFGFECKFLGGIWRRVVRLEAVDGVVRCLKKLGSRTCNILRTNYDNYILHSLSSSRSLASSNTRIEPLTYGNRNMVYMGDVIGVAVARMHYAFPCTHASPSVCGYF